MADQSTPAEPHHHIGFESFGVRVAIAASSPEVLARAETIRPPLSSVIEPTEDDSHFVLHGLENGTYRVEHQDGSVSGSPDLQIALEVLGAQVRAYVALHAPSRIFVHAGVVAQGGRAMLLPAPSFSGKTTLVAELVRRGAVYYSDEFAVLDGEGLVHPYPKPLSIRNGYALDQTEHDVGRFGGVAGDSPIPVGLIAITTYGAAARWQPERLSGGEAVLALLSNTVPAQTRPEQSLAAIRGAVEGAVVLQGERGDAAEVAGELLERLSANSSDASVTQT